MTFSHGFGIKAVTNTLGLSILSHELALGAIQLAGLHVVRGPSPGQISDEQVPDHAVPHVQVPAVESHAPGVPPNVQQLVVFLYRWEY